MTEQATDDIPSAATSATPTVSRRRSDIKRIATIGLAAFLAVILAGTALAAATAPSLGTAKSFAVLAGTTITNTGATTITGDVGLHPGAAVTGFDTVTLDGAQHVADPVALDAKNALVTAYDQAAGATPVTSVPTELGGTTLKPGVYGSATLGFTGTLTLDGEGVYIFQAGSTLITAPNSEVALIGGASACNVYWQVGSSATLDTGTKFKGTIMALTSIALNTGATLQGRALARDGAVTMDNNTIDSSACRRPVPPRSPARSRARSRQRRPRRPTPSPRCPPRSPTRSPRHSLSSCSSPRSRWSARSASRSSDPARATDRAIGSMRIGARSAQPGRAPIALTDVSAGRAGSPCSKSGC